MKLPTALLPVVLHFNLLPVASPAAAEEDLAVTAPPESLRLDPFYKKYVSAGGYPVVGSEKVNDYALKEAAYLIDRMLARRPDVRKAMIESGSRMVVMAHDEFTTDVPEHSRLRPKDYWDRRARGLGGSKTDPVCSSAEENLLAFPGDPYAAECILIHEFAHNIHHRGLARLDPSFDDRLEKTYRQAMDQGLWKGKYASVNKDEYFAEGVQSWFDDNRPPDHDHNHVDTRAELREYDPGLAALCEEVFGDTALAYTKPATRLTGHLEGYDPAKAPAFRWPERLADIGKEIRRKAERRGEEAAGGGGAEDPWPEHRVREIEGWKVHVDASLLDGEHAATGRLALRILGDKLHRIALVMHEDRLEKLRQAPIFIDREHRLKAMQYHPAVKWLRDNGHDPAMEKAVHIPRAEGLIGHERTQDQPWVVLHELAHAYHDRVLGFDHPPIRRAYERARDAGLYQKVLHRRGNETRHYALSDHKEFFAELTECYFGTNDFYPFVRAELQQYDPETFKLLEEIWGPRPR